MITWLQYVPHHKVESFKAKGWTATSGLSGTVHETHAVLMSATNSSWLPVLGFEGLYEVSVSGHVKSLDRLMQSPHAKKGYPRKMKGRILSPRKSKYLQVVLHGEDGSFVHKYVAHLVAEAWIGPRPSGCDVCHNDGNSTNNHASNLRYDSRKGNEADKVSHGTVCRGEKVHASKLTEMDVRKIRTLSVSMRHKEISALFGVGEQTIDFIVNRRLWGHLGPVEGEAGTPAADAIRRENIKRFRSERMRQMNLKGVP